VAHRKLVFGLVACSLFAALGVPTAQGESSAAARYPYDPACPWGRIANGKGMLVRCISEQEASALLSSGPAPAPAAAPTPAEAPAAPDAAPATPEAPPQRLEVAVGPVTVDAGTLPQAEKKLGLPKDRYIDCVNKHGGLSASSAEVKVRFLVRARGRAEGVSVASHRGMSQAAARCIADVIDRRAVGTPEREMVGATIVVKVSAAKR